MLLQSISVIVSYQKKLTLIWKNLFYQYKVLPNSFAPAVKVFTKVPSPQFKWLRPQNILTIPFYLRRQQKIAIKT